MSLIPSHYDTRESFRAKFAAAYDDGQALVDLASDLCGELQKNAQHIDTGDDWYNGTMPALRELALALENAIGAVDRAQDAFQAARVSEDVAAWRKANAHLFRAAGVA
jgi:hypothetical protein